MNEMNVVCWTSHVFETIQRETRHRLDPGDVVIILNDPPKTGFTQPIMARVLTKHGLGWMSWASVTNDILGEPWCSDDDE